MADETLYVDPEFLRIAGDAVSEIGDAIRGDFAKARQSSEPLPSSALAVSRAVTTLDKLWQNYLGQLGRSVSGNGDRLVKIANAYEKCDAEAAAALGVALPADGPVVKARPGRPPE